jgi:hypothetical protein
VRNASASGDACHRRGGRLRPRIAYALAANADDPIKTVYQESASASCSAEVECTMLFPALSNGTLILHTSCQFLLAQGTSPAFFVTLTGTKSTGKNFFNITAHGTAEFFTYYTIDAQNYLYLAEGHQPEITLFGQGGAPVNFTCTISGYHT